MSKSFVVKKRIPLSELGEGWEEAYITLTPFTFRDNDRLITLRSYVTAQNMTDEQNKKASAEIIGLLQEKFVEGAGFTGEKLEPITKENLADLPMEAIVKVLLTLQGQAALPPKV